MTYHRTCGKGGTRNKKAGKLPNFNKSEGSGRNRKGRMLPNAGPSAGNYPPKQKR